MYTLEDTIMDGRHFYSEGTLGDSFRAGMMENLYGRFSTNTEHLASETILFRTLKMYLHNMELALEDADLDGTCQEKNGDVNLLTASPLQVRIPHSSVLLPLLAMCVFPERFEPQELVDSKGNVIPWRWPLTLGQDRLDIKNVALRMLKMRPELFHGLQEVAQHMDQFLHHRLGSEQDDGGHKGPEDEPQEPEEPVQDDGGVQDGNDDREGSGGEDEDGNSGDER